MRHRLFYCQFLISLKLTLETFLDTSRALLQVVEVRHILNIKNNSKELNKDLTLYFIARERAEYWAERAISNDAGDFERLLANVLARHLLCLTVTKLQTL